MVTDRNKRGQRGDIAISDNTYFQSWLQSLRASGYRMTEARLALLAIIANAQCVLNAEQIYELAHAHSYGLGRATIYRTLEKLEALGLIQRVHDTHGCHAFAPCKSAPSQTLPTQALAICEICGRLDYLPAAPFQQALAMIEASSDYRVHHYSLQLSGTCTGCAKGNAHAAT